MTTRVAKNKLCLIATCIHTHTHTKKLYECNTKWFSTFVIVIVIAVVIICVCNYGSSIIPSYTGGDEKWKWNWKNNNNNNNNNKEKTLKLNWFMRRQIVWVLEINYKTKQIIQRKAKKKNTCIHSQTLIHSYKYTLIQMEYV